jgi:hypothetical protein
MGFFYILSDQSLKMHITLNQYTQYSPFLSSYSSFHDTDVVDVECNEASMQNYLRFLQGEDFRFTEEDAEFFDYMGHINVNGYPLDYWKLKLKAAWIRDNFHRLQLDKDPLYGLIRVPIIRRITTPLELDSSHTLIAGGAALYMAGIGYIDDIDLFSLDKDKSLSTFRGYVEPLPNKKGISMTGNCFKVTLYCTISYTYREQTTPWTITHSLIRRVYSSPSEIVHSFDIDCCQLILVGDELYGTELAVNAITNRYQYPDTQWFSSTYIQRLAKYHQRGIQLRMPLLSAKDLVCENHLLLTAIYAELYEVIKELIERYKIDTSPVALLCYISFYNITSTVLIRALTGDEGKADYSHPIFHDIVWNSKWLTLKQESLSTNMYAERSAPLIQLYKECPILSSEFKRSLP